MRVLTVSVTGDSRLRLFFRMVFRGKLIWLSPFEPMDPLHDKVFFAQVDTSGMTIECSGGIDYCPDTLREWCEAGQVRSETLKVCL